MEAANKARIEAELQHEEDARKHAQSVVRLAATDQLNSEIITNRTRGEENGRTIARDFPLKGREIGKHSPR